MPNGKCQTAGNWNRKDSRVKTKVTSDKSAESAVTSHPKLKTSPEGSVV